MTERLFFSLHSQTFNKYPFPRGEVRVAPRYQQSETIRAGTEKARGQVLLTLRNRVRTHPSHTAWGCSWCRWGRRDPEMRPVRAGSVPGEPWGGGWASLPARRSISPFISMPLHLHRPAGLREGTAAAGAPSEAHDRPPSSACWPQSHGRLPHLLLCYFASTQ